MKKILISLLSIIFIISMFTCAYAATGSINLGASSDTVIKGKTFTVTVAATADSNIKGMQSSLSYDSNKLSIESKSAGQGYFDASGSNEIAIGSTSSDSLAQSGTLYTITFKVLDTAEEGSTTISVTNAKLALVSGETEPTSGEVTITIKADDTTAGGNQGGTNDEEEQTPSNGDSNGNASTDSGNGNSGTEEKKENVANANKTTTTNKNKTTTKLPQTGAESTVLIAIVALGIVSIVSYISYRKYNNI